MEKKGGGPPFNQRTAARSSTRCQILPAWGRARARALPFFANFMSGRETEPLPSGVGLKVGLAMGGRRSQPLTGGACVVKWEAPSRRERSRGGRSARGSGRNCQPPPLFLGVLGMAARRIDKTFSHLSSKNGQICTRGGADLFSPPRISLRGSAECGEWSRLTTSHRTGVKPGAPRQRPGVPSLHQKSWRQRCFFFVPPTRNSCSLGRASRYLWTGSCRRREGPKPSSGCPPCPSVRQGKGPS